MNTKRLTLKARWVRAFYAEFQRIEQKAIQEWGHCPITFEEWMDERTDFETLRANAEITAKAQNKLMSDIITTLIGIEIIANRRGVYQVVERESHRLLVALGYHQE